MMRAEQAFVRLDVFAQRRIARIARSIFGTLAGVVAGVDFDAGIVDAKLHADTFTVRVPGIGFGLKAVMDMDRPQR